MNFLFLLLSSLVLKAGNIQSIRQSQISLVRIYGQGAQVERTYSATLEPGANTLNLEGLSSAIDANSILITGTGEATLSSVGYKLDYLTGNKRPFEVLRLEDSLKLTVRALEKVAGLEEVYNDEVGMMNANRSVGGANIGVDVDNLREVADFYRERMIELKIKLIDIREERKKLKDTNDRLSKQLADWNARMSRPQGTVQAELVAQRRVNVTFKLSYYTQGASWSPSYEIRVNQLDQPLRLISKADVMQNTGEEWTNAHIVLSTGNPSLGGSKPEMSPWYLDFLAPVQVRGQRSYQMNEMAPAVMSMQADDSFKSMSENVSVSAQPTTIDYDISMPYTISSDNQPVAIAIRSEELQASYTYYAVPKIDKDAFLLARIGGWQSLDLLPGNASVYFEENYVGQSMIDPAVTTDSIDFSLGRDKRIVITREKKQEFSQKKIMGGNIVKDYLFEVTVRNQKKEPVRLLLEDQLPVSMQGEIKVSASELSGGMLDESTGKVTWKMELPAGATEKRSLGFSVKSPKDRLISGQ